VTEKKPRHTQSLLVHDYFFLLRKRKEERKKERQTDKKKKKKERRKKERKFIYLMVFTANTYSLAFDDKIVRCFVGNTRVHQIRALQTCFDALVTMLCRIGLPGYGQGLCFIPGTRMGPVPDFNFISRGCLFTCSAQLKVLSSKMDPAEIRLIQ
jgi:hypothetical protein